jgi:hypothetical protein
MPETKLRHTWQYLMMSAHGPPTFYVMHLTAREECAAELVSAEPQDSLPCSQKPAIGPYPGPLQCYSCLPINGRIFMFSHLRLNFPSGLSTPEILRLKFCINFSSPLCVLHVLPSYPSLLNHPNNIWRRIMKLPVVQVSLSSCHLLPHGFKYFPQRFSDTLSLCSPFVWETKFHTHKTNRTVL